MSDPFAGLLPALAGLPLLAALVLLVLPGITAAAARAVAVAAAAGVLALATPAALAGPLGFDVPWVPALGVRFHLVLDAVAAPLVLLTALLTLLVCLHRSPGGPPSRVPALLGCVLAVEAGAVTTFLAADLVLFLVAFEVVLIPMWFVIGLWGDPVDPAARRSAATRFVLFTALGSAVLLLGLLLVALTAGTTDVGLLAGRHGAGLPARVQVPAAVLLVVGLGVKVPVWPLHTWLPPAHSIAPTAGSVLLAGVLLKMGTYGLVRLVVPVVPVGFSRLAPVLAVLGVAGILWGALACLAQGDLKRLVAFSSVAHMGFVLLGIASGTSAGMQGALFANIAHGVVTGLLFLVAGAVKDRAHTADLAALGSGLRDRAPRLGWLLAFGCLAGLGLPGLAGFWGELLSIYGSWQAGAGGGPLNRLGVVLAVLAGLGTALAAAYLVRVLYLLWHGPADAPPSRSRSPRSIKESAVDQGVPPGDPGGPVDVRDLTGTEALVMGPLVVVTLVLGLLPWLLLNVTGDAVRALLAGG